MIILYGLAAFVALILYLTIKGWMEFIKHQRERYGTIPMLWRWFSGGSPHWVRNEQDRRYRAMYDPSSQHYHFKARLHRALIRTSSTVLLPVLPFAIIFNLSIAWLAVAVLGGSLALEIGWRIQRAEKVRKSRVAMRHVGRAVAPFANQPVRGRTGQWIRFTDPKRQTIRVDLPRNFNPTQQNRDRLKQVVAETAGFHPGSDADWNLEGGNSHVIIKNRKNPPERVELQDIQLAIDENGQDQVTLGLGRGNELVNVSLQEDSPHFGMSVGAGGGKSQLARLVAAQVLHNGGNVLILDPKRISHAWARGLPNVRYARTTQEIHDALMWLDYEVNRRTDVADVGHDVEGDVLANVGPRLLVIAEELNEMTQRLRVYWNDNRPPKAVKKSPAISALESALFMGRQVKINIIAVAQMMTALAAGSGAARENMGVRILGRYTRNNWRMLVPEFEMPFRSMRPGRMQVVTADVREVQVAFITGAQARELAVNGKVTPFPEDVVNEPPAIPPVPDEPEAIEGEIVAESDYASLNSHDHHLKAVPEPSPAERQVTLTEAARIINLSRKILDNARARDKKFPDSCGIRDVPGRPRLYWLNEILEWSEKRRGE